MRESELLSENFLALINWILLTSIYLYNRKRAILLDKILNHDKGNFAQFDQTKS